MKIPKNEMIAEQLYDSSGNLEYVITKSIYPPFAFTLYKVEEKEKLEKIKKTDHPEPLHEIWRGSDSE